MTNAEKEKMAEIVDVVRDALDYLEEGRISIGVEYVKIAKRRISAGSSLRMQDKAIAITSLSPLSDSSSSITFSNVFLTSIDIKTLLTFCVET